MKAKFVYFRPSLERIVTHGLMNGLMNKLR